MIKEEKDLYIYENDNIRFAFTKRSVDAKEIDNLKKVLGNYNFNSDNLSYLSQVHGSDIKEVTDANLDFDVEADALITRKVASPIMIFTADCVPLFFYDEVSGVVALAHAGWKGTYSKIGAKVIEKMTEVSGSKLENIKVFIGPHISGDSYEVSKELVDKFSSLGIDGYYAFRDNSYFLDLEVINRAILEKAGVEKENIKSSNFCTYKDNDKFFSYRKDEATGKRIASVIEIKASRS